MEFRFNLNEIFGQQIVEIGSNLIPPGFAGDKRALWDTQSKITQIVNAMGEASAGAQGLSKPITTADRLRNSEHKLYLLIDQSANSGKGAVTGMLKTGEKGLYVFDREGQHYKVSPPCVLDFYIHESRQRSGFGKNLFEHMLEKQQIEPVKMAIDRPSDKLLGFLNKHYGLDSPVKQMNNYVVYDGFFPRSSEAPRTVAADKSFTPGKKQSANGLQQGIPSSPYGRYGAPRPPCSMGQIIHNDSAVIKRSQEPTGVRSEPVTNVQGQYNMYNSNQAPAWQATQSVPNTSYTYSQNQQTYSQSPQLYAPNQQFVQSPQDQQYQQNRQAWCPPSSGDYAANADFQPTGQFVPQNPIPVGQSPNQNALEENQQASYYAYQLGQGDATNQCNKDQYAVTSTAQQIEGHNANQAHYQQMSHPIAVQQEQTNQNQHIAQCQPQVFTHYQGQNYVYNPQTQQYQLVPSQSQQILPPNVPQQQIYHTRMPVAAESFTTPRENLYSQQRKEPMIPQHFDGTVRKLQPSASMPVQKTGTRQQQHNLPVHETASAPVSYQHQSAVDSRHGNVYNTASIHHHTSNQNETSVIHQNQAVTQATTSQYQTNQQEQPTQPASSVPQSVVQNYDIEKTSTNTEGMVQAQQSTSPAYAETSQVDPAQMPQTNINQHINNQMPHHHNVQNVQQTSSTLQVSANAQQGSLTNPRDMIHQNRPVSSNLSQHGGQNADIRHPANIVDNNNVQASQDTHLRIHNVASSPISQDVQQTSSQRQEPTSGYSSMVYPTNPHQNRPVSSNLSQYGGQNGNRVMVEPSEANCQSNNQMMMQPVPATTQAQHSQQQMIFQQQQLGQRQYNLANQQTTMNRNQNEYGFAGEQQYTPQAQKVHRKLGQVTNGFSQDESEKCKAGSDVIRRVRQEQEFDYSQGYPPHPEKPAQNSTPRADRPQSLNIETIENRGQTNDDAHEAEPHEPLDGAGGDGDSLDGDAADLEEIEREIEIFSVAPMDGTPGSKGSKSPGMEAAGIVTPGRNTPGLTDQGYFDLKFYHNKLW